VETDAAAGRLISARVQQAFLPKFENEGQVRQCVTLHRMKPQHNAQTCVM
jgi:hypothetical protein